MGRGKKKGLVTWPEWQKEAWAGVAVEPVEGFPRSSGIECPNRYVLRGETRVCKAGLIDTPVVIECGSEMRRIVHCEVCGHGS